VRDDDARKRLRTTLGALSLTAIDARLEALLESASKKEPSYGDFLLEVMNAEADARRQRYLKTRLQRAHMPYVTTFGQFDFAFQSSIDERQIKEVRTLRFVHEASNVILLGPPGVGKTHLAACRDAHCMSAGRPKRRRKGRHHTAHRADASSPSRLRSSNAAQTPPSAIPDRWYYSNPGMPS
jgi:DNA replication protein DnaC